MSDSWFRDGSMLVLVRTGMPEHNVEIGIGDTYAEAIDNLETTACQSTGRDSGIKCALNYAHSNGWINDPDALIETDDPDDDALIETDGPDYD